MRFVDTNVLLYAVSTSGSERRKREVARTLLEAEDLALSVQVLQEFYVQATRSGKPDRISHEQASLLMETFLRYPVQEMTVSVLRAAVAECARHRISYWDAAVLAAARTLGCDRVLSEDFSPGHSYDGIRVVDPFRIPAAEPS